jgi:isoleucyl-tRNA synthetase
MSWEILKERAEPYKKIRNTFRYMLGWLSDFDPSKHRAAELTEVDRWAKSALDGLVKRVTKHYEDYEFFRAYQELYQFCVVELSSLYFDILKDRQTLKADSKERRSAQTLLHEILLALTKMFAPVLCHTMEEVWDYLPGKEAESVHLAAWPQATDLAPDPKWERVFKARAEVYRELEKLRASKAIGKSLEAKVTLHSTDAETMKALRSTDLREVFIVSEAVVADAPVGPEAPELKGFSVKVEKSAHPKCERCWNLRPDVGSVAAHPALCARCAQVVG